MGEFNINQPVAGLNTDNTESQLPKGSLTDALNAQIGNFDGNQITYQNEQSNIKCTNFPNNLKVIGLKNITQINRVLFFLTDETNHEIGYIDNDSCVYQRLLWGDCLNFSIDFPIQQIEVKQTNCSIQVYWTDNNNSMRYFDFEDLPWREITDPNNEFKKIKIEGELDCNRMLIQANFSIPEVEVLSVEEGGSLVTGTYQFVIQYSNQDGLGYTQFYNVSNPVSINQPDRTTQDFNLPTSKAIRVIVNNLDNSGLFDYFNLVVIETVNLTSTLKLVGTYPISQTSTDILYTGSATAIQLSPNDIFQKYQFYDTAEGVTQSDNRIIWYNVKEKQRINYQNIWSKVELFWETHRIPYNEFEGYNNPLNTYLYKGYMRDEVYSFEGMFILKNGKETDSFHIPGRVANVFDREQVTNPDSLITQNNPCDTELQTKERWQVYNTASKFGFTSEYLNGKQDDCYKGSYEYGEMAFWESEETYPISPIWGDLAGLPIRHHKFPDSLITHIHDNTQVTQGYKSAQPAIYPIGIKLVMQSLYSAIATSNLTEEEKNEIVGFKILRGDRSATGYKSIIAKGLMNNVGYTVYDDIKQYYPNYPFNDLRPDPFFVSEKLPAQSGFRPDKSVNGFQQSSKSRFTFHSPDTHFNQPFGVDSGFLKMETIEYGKSYGHFVSVRDNAEYKFLTAKVTQAALAIAQVSGLNIATGTFGWPSYTLSNILPAFSGAKELFEKLANYTNFGYSFNSLGIYNSYFPIPNEGLKQRSIDYGKYIIDGKNAIEDGNTLEAFRRESSVYIHTEGDYLFPHEYDNSIPQDTSRYNISSYKGVDSTAFRNAFVTTNSTIIPDSYIKSFSPNTELVSYKGYVSAFLTPGTGSIFPQDIYEISGLGYQVEIYQVIGSQVYYTFTDPSSVDTSLIPSSVNFDLVDQADPDTDSAPSFTITSISETSDEINNSIKFYNIIDDVRTQFLLMVSDENYIPTNDIGRLAIQIYNAYSTIYFQQLYPNVNPETIRETNISSYYGSIKAYLPAQWGRMYSYSTIDTGFYSTLLDENGNQYISVPTIYGGDTFINKFALKIKLPFFKIFTVGQNFENQTDIAYNELGTINYPMFWISTKPAENDLDISEYVDKILEEAPGNSPGGGFLSKLWNIVKNLFSGGAASSFKILAQMGKIIKEIGLFADANINLDEMTENGLIKEGKMYLFAYGIPYFFCESQINVDYRQATNNNEGNFYPRISSDIPDDWIQETTVPIINDNNYTYNQTFSKQNKENFYSHLREDFDPDKECYREFPNRAFWSEKTDLNETRNNWLIYKPLNRFDFTKSFGNLTSLDGILNRQIIARFENKTQIYNALTAVQTNNPLTAYLGNPELFTSTPPIDFAETDTGSMGSQHKFLLKTENGVVFTDAKRGQVILLRGSEPTIISEAGNSKWFSNNLPFQISKFIKQVDTDNTYKGIGITGIYDEYYQRLIITKKDYKVKNPENLEFICGNFVDVSTKQQIIKEQKAKQWYFESQDCNKLLFSKAETITNLPRNTDIYAFFDTTSMQPSDGVAAAEALKSWFDTVKITNPDYAGNLYILPLSGISTERYLLHPNVIYSGSNSINSSSIWPSITILPPNFNTSDWVAPKDVVCLSFVDEANTDYHATTVAAGFSTPTQPTVNYQSDYTIFSTIIQNFDSFKAVLYPIVQSVSGVSGALVLQSMAAIFGRTLTPEEIAATNTTVDVSLLETTNPYEGFEISGQPMLPLSQLGWRGVYDKLSPASEVFNSETFGQELSELLDLGGEITYTRYKTIELPIVELYDEKWFEDISWTMSYSFLTNSWISKHSYKPDYFIGYPTYFQSGLNKDSSLWSHNKSLTSYCTYYGVQEPYIIEVPFVYKTEDEILQSVKDYCSALIYTNEYEFAEPDEILYFNKTICYNRQQCSGLRELIPVPQNSLKAKISYPKYKANSTEILVCKEENFINFNMIWDIVKNKSLPFIDKNKQLIDSNLDYTNRSFKKYPLRAKDARIRLILDNKNNFKLISRYLLTENQPSQ